MLSYKRTFDGTNVDGFNAHQVRQLFQDNSSVSSIVLVDTANLTLYPVRPVQIVTYKYKCTFYMEASLFLETHLIMHQTIGLTGYQTPNPNP